MLLRKRRNALCHIHASGSIFTPQIVPRPVRLVRAVRIGRVPVAAVRIFIRILPTGVGAGVATPFDGAIRVLAIVTTGALIGIGVGGVGRPAIASLAFLHCPFDGGDATIADASIGMLMDAVRCVRRFRQFGARQQGAGSRQGVNRFGGRLFR